MFRVMADHLMSSPLHLETVKRLQKDVQMADERGQPSSPRLKAIPLCLTAVFSLLFGTTG